LGEMPHAATTNPAVDSVLYGYLT